MRSLVCALVFTIGGGTVVVNAGELKPIQAQSIALGSIQGVAYYTVEPEGFRVVTTVTAGENALRLTSTLGPDQNVVLSVPGAVGEAETKIEFIRLGDQLFVNDGPVAAKLSRDGLR